MPNRFSPPRMMAVQRPHRKTFVFRAAFALLAVTMLILGVGAERVNNERYVAQVRSTTNDELTRISTALSGQLHADLQLVRGLVSVIHLNPNLNQAQYETAMRPLFEGRNHLRNVAAAPDLVIRLMYPLAGNERAVGLDYRKVPSQLAAVERARDTRAVVMAGPLTLVQGGTGLIARVPVFVPDGKSGERFWGVVSAVIDTERLFRNSGLQDSNTQFEYALRGVDGKGEAGDVFFGRAALFDEQPERVVITHLTGTWILAAAPRAGWPAQADNAWAVRLGIALAALVIFGALAMQARAVALADAAQSHAEAASQQLTALIEQSPDAMVIVNDNGHIAMVNRQTETLFGWPREELLGRSPDLLLPKAQRQEYIAAQRGYFESIKGTGPLSIRRPIEFAALHKDGSLIDVEICLSPLPTEQGVMATGVLRDIRARKQSEARAKMIERRVSAIADNLPILISHFDREVKYLFANAYFSKFFNVDHQSLVGRGLREFRGEAVYAQLAEHVSAVLAGQAQTFDSHAMINGEQHFFHQNFVPDVDSDGTVQGFYSVSVDMSDIKRSEMHLASSRKHLRMIADNIPALIAHLDAECRFRFANAAWADFYQVQPQDMVGQTMAHAMGDAFYTQHKPYLDEAFLTGQRVQFETEAHVNGATRILSMSFMPDLDEDNHVVGLYSLGLDVTAQKAVETQLAEQARVDHLTGLPNRRGFEDRVVQAVARARRGRHIVGVMYLDVDYFKQINDQHGHAAGDAVLQTVARRLQAAVRGTDTVARLGGDEFVVLLENLQIDREAEVVANKILAAARQPVEISEGVFSISVSIGIGLYAGASHAQDIDDVLKYADEALYAAKRAGRDQFKVFIPS